jgi:hypothetical protein
MELVASRRFSYAAIGFIVVYAAVWTLISFLFDPSVPYDAVEALNWANNAGFSSPKNPYMVGGVMAIGQWLAPTLSLSLYWYLSHFIGVAAGMLGVWLLSRRLFGENEIAWLSFMSLNLTGIINFDVIAYNDNYLLVAFWPYLFLFFVKAIYDHPVHWLSLALVAGLAAMAKYSTFVFLPFMLAYILWVPAARKAFRSPAFYLAGVLFLLLLAPNAVWLVQHDNAAFNWVQSEITRGLSFDAPVAFLSVFYPALVLTAVLLPLGGKRGWPGTAEKRAVLFVFTPPLVLLFLYFLFNRGDRLTEWLQPFAMLTPVALLSWLDVGQVKCFRRISNSLAGVAVVMCAGYTLVYQQNIQGEGQKFKYITTVSAEINAAWQAKYHQPLKYVGGGYLAQWLTFYAPDRPLITTRWSNEKKPNVYNAQITARDIWEQGALFLSEKNVTCAQTRFEQVPLDFPGVAVEDQQEYSFRDEQGRTITLCLGFAPPHPAVARDE